MEPTASPSKLARDAPLSSEKNAEVSAYSASEEYKPIARGSDESGRRRGTQRAAFRASGASPAFGVSSSPLDVFSSAGTSTKGLSGTSGASQKATFAKELGNGGMGLPSNNYVLEAGVRTGAPRPTFPPSLITVAQIARVIHKALKELDMYYYRSNVVCISPAHGTGAETVRRVLTSCTKSIAAEGGFADINKDRLRMTGNLTYGFDTCHFQLQMSTVKGTDSKKQLAVELRPTTRNGRIAFSILLQKVAWDLNQAGLAEFLADGREILKPAKDVIEEMEAQNVADMSVSEDEDDDLCMPSMIGSRPKTGIQLDRKNSKDLVDCWATMLEHRSCPDVLKIIARCAERDSNAQIIGENESLMKQIVTMIKTKSQASSRDQKKRQNKPDLKTKDNHPSRDQQVIHCAISIVSKALPHVPESLMDSDIVEALADNLLYFGIGKTSLRCVEIQDAVIRTLSILAKNSNLEKLVSSKSRDMFKKIFEQKGKIGNEESKRTFTNLCSMMGVVM